MPPRWMTGIIIGFWLATTGWMIYREAVPRLRAGQPPAFTIDLTDEVSANTIAWTVWQKGEKVGMGRSWVRRQADRTFELCSEFRFHDLQLLKLFKFRKMISVYRVTAEGMLRGLAVEVYLEDSPIQVEIHGRVEDGFFAPRVKAKIEEKEYDLPFPEKIKISPQGSVLNPMHLVNRISGLKEGQQWLIPMLDPLSSQLPGQRLSTLQAEVSRDLLPWNGLEISCFKVEYREPGKSVLARTWVRQKDGLVLQQEAWHQGKEIVLKRDK